MDDYSGGYDWSDIQDWRNNNHSRKGEIVDKDYKILSVDPRQAYDTDYGQMQPYALTLEGVEGYVQLSQKPETPAPVVGQVIHGHTYNQGKFLKFKKVNPNYAGNNGGSKPQSSADMGRVMEYLEAIAVAVGAEVAGKQDTAPEDVDDRPIDLSAIPF